MEEFNGSETFSGSLGEATSEEPERRSKAEFIRDGFDPVRHAHETIPQVETFTCRRCQQPYVGAASIPLCPLCERRVFSVHLRKLQDRRMALRAELADVTAQIESNIRNFRYTALAPQDVAETITCFMCDASCIDLYAKLGDHIICQECAHRSGLEHLVDDKKCEQCPHGVSVFRCRPCRQEKIKYIAAQHAEDEKRGREASRTSYLSKPVRRRAEPVNMDEIESI